MDERGRSLEELAHALDSAATHTELSTQFARRAKLARWEAKVARSQAAMHAREAARAKAEIGALQARVNAVQTGKRVRPARR